MTGRSGTGTVDDIHRALEALVGAGAVAEEAAHDVGGGRLIAPVRDVDENLIGVLQDPT